MKTLMERPSKPTVDLPTAKAHRGCGGKSSADFRVLCLRPTKKRGAVKANAWVRLFDAIDVQLKLIEGPDGLFVAPPTGEYRDAGGRTRYIRRFEFADYGLPGRVETAVLEAYAGL